PRGQKYDPAATRRRSLVLTLSGSALSAADGRGRRSGPRAERRTKMGAGWRPPWAVHETFSRETAPASRRGLLLQRTRSRRGVSGIRTRNRKSVGLESFPVRQ